jgi:hypothetical protein
MTPNGSALAALVGKNFVWDTSLYSANTGDGLLERSIAASLTLTGDTATVKTGSGGLWVPYIEQTAVIGYLPSGATWGGTGPFSGCMLAIGLHKTKGRIFMAHVAVQSGSKGPEAWKAFMANNDLAIWYMNNIRLPDVNYHCGRHVFATFSGSGIGSMTEVDVDTLGKPASASGRIFAVKSRK